MEKASPEVIRRNLGIARAEKKKREAVASFKARTAEAKQPLVHNPFAKLLK